MIDSKLYTLLAVFEQGGFTKAAEALNLTQPAVSQQIRQLEELYGCRIFERGGKELRTTKEGEIIIRTAYRIQSLVEDMKTELLGDTDSITVLTVGLTHSAESNAITEVLASFAHERGISFRIVTGGLERLTRMLKNYELDFIIVEGHLDVGNFRQLRIDTDSLVLIVSPEHPLAKRKTVTIDRICKEKMILRRRDSNTGNLFISSLETRSVSIDSFNVIMEIDNVASIKDLVRRGLGVSVLPKSVCLDELKNGTLVALKIKDLSMEREISIACNQDFANESLLHEIIQAYHKLS
jgi:DNA-binding transcriptional LysR family regulator